MDHPAPHPTPFQPRKAILFAGHRLDEPGRSPARFPARHERAAAARIASALARLDAGPHDLALTQGAAGGDLLFGEACRARGVPLQLLLPLPEARFIAVSLRPSSDGADWERRYFALKAALPWPPRVMPPATGDPFEACNRWLLDTALASGAELHLVCLWNGQEGSGPGDTAHLVREVRRCGGAVVWIDSRSLQADRR